MKQIPALGFFAVLTLLIFGQEVTAQTDSLRKDALNVFMDATPFQKERITFINYVRDRKVADLVIISTSEITGSGGREYTMFLEGMGAYSGMVDTLKYSTLPDDTEDQRREKELQVLKMGLIRYIIKTPLAEYIKIDFTEPITSTISTDKWDSWVFKADISGYSNGQSSIKQTTLWGGVTASRITDEWKYTFNFNYSYHNNKYEYEDVIYSSITNSKSFNTLIVNSLNDHWSLGGSAGIYASTFANYDFRTYISPGVEYNIFPYSESTSRQFRMRYSLGAGYNDYADSTIYNKTTEFMISHSLRSTYQVIRKWGSIELSASWSNYLRDVSENQLSIWGNINWRIAKGLSLTAGSAYSFINNQVNLAKGELSPEEVLLEIQELKTDYTYYFHFGFSYTFGSIYNNVVNPRFGGGSPGRTVVVY